METFLVSVKSTSPGSCLSSRSGSKNVSDLRPYKGRLRHKFGPKGLKNASKFQNYGKMLTILTSVKNTSSMLWNKYRLRLGIGLKLKSCLGLVKKLELTIRITLSSCSYKHWWLRYTCGRPKALIWERVVTVIAKHSHAHV